MSNSKSDFNLPTLKHYSEEQAWNFLIKFDRTPRSLWQNQLNYYKERLNYLGICASNVNRITLNILRDQITLLGLTFDYTRLYQPNKEINESLITYDNTSTDVEEEIELTKKITKY